MVRPRQAPGRSLCRRDRPALCLRRAAGGTPRRGRRYGAADAEGDRHAIAASTASQAAAVFGRRADLRGACPRADHSPSRHSRAVARHRRRARPSGDRRAPRQARRVGGRTDACRRLDRRTPSRSARADQCLGLQPRHLQGARPAPGAGRHRRTARYRGGTARSRHRRHPRPRLQPHRRERQVRPDAVAARARRRRLLPARAQQSGPARSTTPAPATPSPAIARRRPR